MAKEKRELVHRSYSRSGGSKVAGHLFPNQVTDVFEFQGERERRKFSIFKGLQKPLSAQIQEN
jgi:predicted DNA-binding protein with PD1-like motif